MLSELSGPYRNQPGNCNCELIDRFLSNPQEYENHETQWFYQLAIHERLKMKIKECEHLLVTIATAILEPSRISKMEIF